MKLFGNQIRWSDPEYEAWKREQSAKYGWGGPDSIWTVKLMLVVVLIILVFVVIAGALSVSLFSSWKP
jgi:hypothetical protein